MSSKKKKADTTRYQIKAKYLKLQHTTVSLPDNYESLI